MPQNILQLYNASAGSGKTYTLVKKYLSLLLLSEDQKYNFSHILAITFTNDATSEMKHRIVKALYEFAIYDIESNKNGFFQDFAVEYNLEPQVLKKRSQGLLHKILNNYSDFNINTIDSFFTKIVRTYAQELNLGFNLGFNLEVEELLEQAVDILLEELDLNNQNNTTRFIINHYINTTEHKKLKQELLNFADNLYKEVHYFEISKIEKQLIDYQELITELEKDKIEIINKITIKCKAAKQLIIDNARELNDFAGGIHGLGNLWDKALKNNDYEVLFCLNINRKGVSKTIYKTIINDNWYAKTKSKAVKEQIENIKDQLILIYYECLEFSKEFLNSSMMLEALPVQYLGLEVIKKLRQLFQQKNILDIYTAKAMVSDIIDKEGVVPMIYENLAFKFHYYFIDEFQDTSDLQFKNLYPLVKESLDTGNFSMLVGDPKQSIYRWRGGEVDNFINLLYQNDVPQIKALMPFIEKETLNYNFRSRENIIHFNNDFFSQENPYLVGLYKDAYKDVKQNVPDKKEQKNGYVYLKAFALLDLENNEENKNNDTPEERIDEDAASASYIEIIAKDLLEKIIDIKNRGYDFNDVAILCKTHKQVALIAHLLTENDLPFVSENALTYNASQEVLFLISWLKLYINPEDEISKIFIINFLEKNKIINTSLVKYLSTDKVSLNLCLKDNHIKLNWTELKHLSIYEYTNQIICSFFHENNINNVFVNFFLSEIKSFEEQNHAHDFYNFLIYWDQKLNKKDVRFQGAKHSHAIILQTIHKSKGLQYPIVFIPFTNKQLNTSKHKNGWQFFRYKNQPLNLLISSSNLSKLSNYDEELALKIDVEKQKSNFDTINELYVAQTRAVDELYIFTNQSVTRKKLKEEDNLFNLYSDFVTSQGIEKAEIFLYEKGLPMHKEIITDKKEVLKTFNIKSKQTFLNFEKDFSLSDHASSNLKIEHHYSEQQEFGEQLHIFLSKIKYLDDYQTVENEIKNSKIGSDEKATNYLQVIKSIIYHPDLKVYFDTSFQVYNEKIILRNDGTSYRCDRLVIGENIGVVIDYKTGDVSDNHVNQMENYLQIVKDALSLPVKGIIVYTQNLQLVPIFI